MPGIESYSRRRPDDPDDMRLAQQLRELYRRALVALNQYIIVKLGAGKAPVAGLLLNYIFADEVLQPDDPAIAAAGREFASLAGSALADRARELLQNFPVLRRPLLSTLLVKRLTDLAHERNSLVDALDRSWVFRTYSSRRSLRTLRSYMVGWSTRLITTTVCTTSDTWLRPRACLRAYICRIPAYHSRLPITLSVTLTQASSPATLLRLFATPGAISSLFSGDISRMSATSASN